MKFPFQKLTIWLLVLFLVSCGSSGGDGNESYSLTSDKGPDILLPSLCQSGDIATVITVIDGDTIEVSINGAIERVRYIGINTPEVGQKCASEATDFNRSLVENQTVSLIQDVSDRDVYGRLLRYVCVGDLFVNGQLVSSGYAEAVAYPPDTAYADYLEALETDAKTAGRGCLYGSSSTTCCKICWTGKACGDTCIRRDYTCNQPPGCACNGY